MLDASQLFTFLAASVLLTISPGPDVLATISIGLSRGWVAAVSFGVGCALGCLLHTSAAVLGASAVISTSPAAYSAMKLICGGYLAWLGVSILRTSLSRSPATEGIAAQQETQLLQKAGPSTPESALLHRDFFRGLLANATNPKVAVFFLSFLPSFVRPGSLRPELQLSLLGVVFTLQAMVIFAAIGFCSGLCGRLLKSFPGLSRSLDLLCGLLFLVLAAVLVGSTAKVALPGKL